MRAIVLLLVIPCAAIHSMGRPAQNAAALVAAMAELDSDGSGEVDYTEFVGWWQRQDSESQRLIEQQQGNGPAVEFKARRSKARPSLKSVGQGVVKMLTYHMRWELAVKGVSWHSTGTMGTAGPPSAAAAPRHPDPSTPDSPGHDVPKDAVADPDPPSRA